jgi:hypothetical protein
MGHDDPVDVSRADLQGLVGVALGVDIGDNGRLKGFVRAFHRAINLVFSAGLLSNFNDQARCQAFNDVSKRLVGLRYVLILLLGQGHAPELPLGYFLQRLEHQPGFFQGILYVFRHQVL